MSAGNDGSIDREVDPRSASNDKRGNFTSNLKTFPTPWRIERGNSPIADTGDYDGVTSINAANGAEVVVVWNASDEQEEALERIVRSVNGSAPETKARLCECIPLAPRPYKFCQDCGGQIPVHQQQPFTGSAQETSAPLTPAEMGTVARMAAVSAQVQPEKASTEGRPLTAAEAKVIEEFGDELVTIYPCKCGATPGTTIRGQMFCTNCGEYRADKSQVNGSANGGEK